MLKLNNIRKKEKLLEIRKEIYHEYGLSSFHLIMFESILEFSNRLNELLVIEEWIMEYKIRIKGGD